MQDRIKEFGNTNKEIVEEKMKADFSKIKVGKKTLDDAVYDLGSFTKVNAKMANKKTIMEAIGNYNLKEMKEISTFFYRSSGIYSRILRYMAFMYRYDWYVTPHIKNEKITEKKLLKGFNDSLDLLDSFGVKKKLGEIALEVLKNGCYYGYKIKQGDKVLIQDLPTSYCRSRYSFGDKPAVEFNMKFFDDTFRDVSLRLKILKIFPNEFKTGYILYKEGKLGAEYIGDTNGWYLLEPTNTVKFNASGEDFPAFISSIPLILDLDEAQALDRERTLQKLLKIIIQKVPLDKNMDLVFDNDEIEELHKNAVGMLGGAIGVSVLTTFAEVEVEDMSDSTATQTDDLKRVERQLFNETGISQMQFNTDGNIALEKSLLNDESTMYNLILQFEVFLNDLVSSFNTKDVEYVVQILPTTIYNYKELSKIYREQVTLGYSKMLPQIALGNSQSSVLATAEFENEILGLVNVFVPPMMSSTMSAEMLEKTNTEDKAGRKKLADDEKATKTILNEESKS